MEVKKCFAVLSYSRNIAIAFLLIRIVMGIAFILHGWFKIQNPMSWMGPDSPVPGIFQLLAAVSEFGGGIALIVGLLTRLASLGLAITMLVAAGFHKFVMGDPFVNMQGGGAYELALVYFTISLLFVVAGPGQFSLDRKVFGAK